MNSHQRRITRRNAKQLLKAQECPRCHQTGPHWVMFSMFDRSMPFPTSAPAKEGEEGFWVCDDLYDEDGRRKDPSDAPIQLQVLHQSPMLLFTCLALVDKASQSKLDREEDLIPYYLRDL
jgi:hypothetical protein